MKRKPQPKLSPLYRRLYQHDKMCSYFRYSDGDVRLTHCSCGRDEALKTIAVVRELLGEPTATQLLGKPIG